MSSFNQLHVLINKLNFFVLHSCVKLEKWDEATRFAQNALILCDALLAKRGMKIHTILNKEGTIDAKLFGEWRVKSYLVIALSCIERDDIDGAVVVLKKAKTVAMKYIDEIKAKQQFDMSKNEAASLKILASQMKEVRRLMTDCNEKNKEAKKLERRRAQAMFSTTKYTPNNTSNAIGGTSQEEPTPPKTEAVKHEGDNHSNNTSSEEPSTPPALKSVINDKSAGRPNVRKSVSFSQNPPQIKEFDSSVDDAPWYSEHKEALALMAVAGLSALAYMSFRKRS